MLRQIPMRPEINDEVISITQDLIRQPSFSGHEQAVAKIVETKLRAMDFDEVYIDEYGSVVALRAGKRPGARVLYDAHMDVVPVNDLTEWTVDPFGGEFKYGKIWGRGATDIKGGLAAMVVALGRIPREEISGTLILSASVGEEIIEGFALKNTIENTKPDSVVVIEPTECKLAIGQKGRVSFRINVKGKPAHTSHPEQGENAIYKAIEIAERLKMIPLPADPYLGKGTMELTEIRSTPFPGESIVPYGCSLRFERRLMSEETMDSIHNSIDDALVRIDGWSMEFNEAQYKTYTGHLVQYPEFHAGWIMDRDSLWVNEAQTRLANVGISSGFTTVPYCTNGSYPAGCLHLPTVIFGPSTIKLAHGIDEYIEVDELLKATQGMMGLGGSVGKYLQKF